LPPCEEQGAILEGLAGELSSVNTAISRLEREIDLLLEYRTRLVADVVTGKLDVRPAARHLPTEPEPEPAIPQTVERDSIEAEEVIDAAE
jgi:type I restriction enzyme S subunit